MGKIGKAKGAARYTREGFFMQRYPSISMAAEATGISTHLIKAACEGIYEDAGGYKWKYSSYGKLKSKATKRPKATQAQTAANVNDVLDKIIKANKDG